MKLLSNLQAEAAFMKLEEISPITKGWTTEVISILVASLDMELDEAPSTKARREAMFNYVHRLLGTLLYEQLEGAPLPLQVGQIGIWVREATFRAIAHVRDELPKLAMDAAGADPKPETRDPNPEARS